MKKPIKLELIKPINGYSSTVTYGYAKMGTPCVDIDGSVFLSNGKPGNCELILIQLNNKYDASKGDPRAHLESSSGRHVPVTDWLPVLNGECPFHKEASIVSVMLKDGIFLMKNSGSIDFSEVVACKFERCAEGWEL